MCVHVRVYAGAGHYATCATQHIQSGSTALMVASLGDHAGCIRLLLDAGADKDANAHNGRTALMNAAEKGHADCARLLLDAGAAKDITDNVRVNRTRDLKLLSLSWFYLHNCFRFEQLHLIPVGLFLWYLILG